MLEHVVFTYAFNLGHIEQQVKDLSDEQMVQQPHGVVNHPAWTIGHLASASNQLAKVLGLDSTFPADWEEKFKTGGTPSANWGVLPAKGPAPGGAHGAAPRASPMRSARPIRRRSRTSFRTRAPASISRRSAPFAATS